MPSKNPTTFVLMKNVDFLVVGCGLAGISLCEYLERSGHSFLVYDNQSQNSSSVAAGLYNPVILKRFTPVWKADEQLEIAIPFYKKLEEKLGVTLDYPFEIFRRFASVEEQNLWFTASDKPKLSPYLDLNISNNDNPKLDAPLGLGKVHQAGRLDSQLLISTYRAYLFKRQLLKKENFVYDNLIIENDGLTYTDYKIKNIVFAEGYGLKQNPFFSEAPLTGTKGEVLVIKSKDLKLNKTVKSSIFIIPLGNDLYKVGSTYNREDKTNAPTTEGKDELLSKLKSFINCEFEVVEQKAGVRPTVKDRRPLVGSHPKHPNLFLLNGMGSRGVMIAPYISKCLLDFVLEGKSLPEDIDIRRFKVYH